MKSTFSFARSLSVAATVSATLLTSGVAIAQASYPNAPIKIIAPAPAGGGTDFLARLFGKRLSERLGKSVIVENKPGATGNIGSEMVVRAPADGYTLLMSYQGTHAINPSLVRNMPFDAVNDFQPISQVVSLPFVLVVNPRVPASTMKELVALAKAKPNSLSFGSAGLGSGGHLVGEIFNLQQGIKTTHIPYQGSSPLTTDLLGGHLQFAFDTVSTTGPHILSGKLRALAVTSEQRLAALPNVPTTAEAGFPEMTPRGWYGLFAPKNTPMEIVNKLHTEIVAIAKEPEVRESLIKAGYTPTTSESPEGYRAFVKAEIERWGKVVKSSGARVD